MSNTYLDCYLILKIRPQFYLFLCLKCSLQWESEYQTSPVSSIQMVNSYPSSNGLGLEWHLKNGQKVQFFDNVYNKINIGGQEVSSFQMPAMA